MKNSLTIAIVQPSRNDVNCEENLRNILELLRKYRSLIDVSDVVLLPENWYCRNFIQFNKFVEIGKVTSCISCVAGSVYVRYISSLRLSIVKST